MTPYAQPDASALPGATPETASAGVEEPFCTRVVTSWQALAALRESWDALLASSATNEIFLTFDFLRAWSTAAPRKHELRVVTLWESGVLVGIAPLMLAERVVCSVRLRTIEFLGTPFIDYADFLYAEPRVLEALWRATANLARECDALYLQEVRDVSPTHQFLAAQPRLQSKRGENCLAVNTTAAPDAPAATFLQKPKFARHLNRHARRLGELGQVTLDSYTRPAEIEEQLDTLFAQHKERWNATTTPSCFNNPAMERFYRHLSQELAQSGRMLVAVMRLDGKPLSCHWGFLYNQTYALHTTSRAPSHEQYYTGVVMLAEVVRNLQQWNPSTASVDLCRGEEHYKTYFGALHCTNYSFVRLCSLKARVLMPLFFKGQQLARRYDWVNRAVRKIGRLVYHE